MRTRLRELILCALIDLSVAGAVGAGLAGVATDNPRLIYGGLAGTAATVFIGGCYHDSANHIIRYHDS